MSIEELDGLDVARVRAENPGPYTLSGTNTWVVGRNPAWVVDPGPDISEHIEPWPPRSRRAAAPAGSRSRTTTATTSRGCSRCASGSAARRSAPAATRPTCGSATATASARSRCTRCRATRPTTWRSCGDGACFTGDAVLGEGSVFVAEDLGEYLEALQRLRQLPLRVICPGHGPPVWDPKGKLDEYLAHRREREQKLLAALEDGLRGEDELLDAVWADAPAALRPAAAVTLGAHREKLQAEGRWPQQDGGPPAP